MNYRHQFHAGNFADVVKHALLVRLIRSMQQKETGFLFIDTHAGRGSYDLQEAAKGDSRARAAEWPDGVGRLWERSDLPPAIADYLATVREFDRSRGNLEKSPRFYPGSPRLAAMLARPQDRLALWEKNLAEAAALAADLEREGRTSIRPSDGYGAFRAVLPPPEKRALALIDPPFESPTEWTDVMEALRQAMARLPSGVYVVWYPLTERAQAPGVMPAFRQWTVPVLSAQCIVDPSAKMAGCGLAIVNPPWKFEKEAQEIMRYLSEVLSHKRKGSYSVEWMVPEKP